MTEKPTPQPVQIKASDEALKGVYSNMAHISHTAEEFVVDFLSVYPPAGTLNARVILTPGHAKRLVAALTDNVAKYEAQFGTVKVSDGPATSTAPIGFSEK